MTAAMLSPASLFEHQFGGGYRRDKGMRLPAIMLSGAILGCLLASFAFLHPVLATKQPAEKLLTFDVATQTAPPPPAAAAQAEAKIDPPKVQIVAPPPQVRVPTPAPAIATTSDPAPRLEQVAMVKTAAAAAPPAPPPPPAPAGPVSMGNLLSKLISGTPPTYPAEARHKKETGTVVLRLVLSPGGRLSSITIHKSSGVEVLDTAALNAVRKWRWSPTLRDGAPVEVTGLVNIPFVLKTR